MISTKTPPDYDAIVTMELPAVERPIYPPELLEDEDSVMNKPTKITDPMTEQDFQESLIRLAKMRAAGHPTGGLPDEEMDQILSDITNWGEES